MSLSTTDAFRIGGAVLMLAAGLRMTFKPEAYRHEGVRDNDRAIAERLKRGHDRYFEELRTLRAYSTPRPIRTVRVFGIGLVILSLIVLTLYLFP